MREHRQGLEARRRELVERSDAQRTAILVAGQSLAHKAAVFDRLVAHVRRHPIGIALAVGALALFGPRRLFDWGTRALTLYMLFRR